MADNSAAFASDSCRCASERHTCGLPNREEEVILALARAEELEDALRSTREQIERQAAHISKLRDACYRYDVALERIAAGPRPDGTHNLSREACEQIAKEALDERS